MTALLCDVCAREPRIGNINVPGTGDFGIGQKCVSLRYKALDSNVTLAECRPILKFRRDDPAVNEWVAALITSLKHVARRDHCPHGGNQHTGYIGCTICLCPETNPTKMDEIMEVA